MTIAQIRSALAAKFGNWNYKITASGEIHANGTMPNTNIEGWYLFGHVSDADLSERLT